jgi:hypothetical protein
VPPRYFHQRFAHERPRAKLWLQHRPERNFSDATLACAVAAFLDHADPAATTRRVDHASLAALVDAHDSTRPTPESTKKLVEEWFHTHDAAAAPATCNREPATLHSASAWWRVHGWLPTHTDLTTGLLDCLLAYSDRTLVASLAR